MVTTVATLDVGYTTANAIKIVMEVAMEVLFVILEYVDAIKDHSLLMVLVGIIGMSI